MLIKIATRVLNELNYIDTFIAHYLKMGVNEIHFFDSGSEDGTVERIKDWSSNKQVKLSLSDKTLRHTSYSRETEVCNYVLQHALEDTAQSNKACWWLFPDIDEFLRSPQGGLQSLFEKTKLVFDHLRGISLGAINERLHIRLQLLKEQHQKKMDDWTFEHFSKIKSELEDYNSFYLNSLCSYDELEAMYEHISQYDNSSSFYNKIIY